MEKIMSVWAKISSLVMIIGFIIQLIYVIVTNINSPNLIGLTFLSIVLIVGVVVILSLPLHFFAWSRNKKEKAFKIYAKIITILLPLIILYDIISNKFDDNIIFHIILIIALIPLYYFGWRD